MSIRKTGRLRSFAAVTKSVKCLRHRLEKHVGDKGLMVRLYRRGRSAAGRSGGLRNEGWFRSVPQSADAASFHRESLTARAMERGPALAAPGRTDRLCRLEDDTDAAQGRSGLSV